MLDVAWRISPIRQILSSRAIQYTPYWLPWHADKDVLRRNTTSFRKGSTRIIEMLEHFTGKYQIGRPVTKWQFTRRCSFKIEKWICVARDRNLFGTNIGADLIFNSHRVSLLTEKSPRQVSRAATYLNNHSWVGNVQKFLSASEESFDKHSVYWITASILVEVIARY